MIEVIGTPPPWQRANMESKPLVYLACPYSDPNPAEREYRFHQSNRAAAQLMRLGELVFSPISHTHPIVVECDLPKGWDFWERYDRAVLSCCCRMIVLRLQGWKESKGVQAEMKIAREMGIPVIYMDPK